MAHIISCMLDGDEDSFDLSLNNYIAKAVSPQTSNDSLLEKASAQGCEKPFVWRMHQPERKYQLFPKDRQPAASPGKALDPEQAFALAMGQNGDKTADNSNNNKTSAGNGLRIRIKEHNLIRRRKVSVPELGPMTTVQEVAMDSPTIPGRPPLHERSISAPGSSWKPHNLAETVTFPDTQTPDEKAELDAAGMASMAGVDSGRIDLEARQPLSPKSLAPLVIPATASTAPRLTRQMSLSRIRSGSTPVEPTIRSARTDDSPKSRTPFTPLSASTALTTPRSAAISAMTASALATPVSAPVESRSSPRPWEKAANHAVVGTPRAGSAEPNSTPKADAEPRATPMLGHRRNQSESGSVMERGRPRKRSETTGNMSLKRTASKRNNSAERRAFEQLPKGWKVSEAANMLNQSEAAAIQKQALQQAARFEILRKDDVDNLSRELRHLDERTEYLRRTYTSLRAGRRNLHSRICQYLRSPRTAKFSHDSILKQEEALAELDASIDDWVTKLEQAENRRTRVRQKLLEHVAAAATLPLSQGLVGVSQCLQFAMGVRSPESAHAANISTPPRSPTKTSFTAPHTQSSSPSPQRVVAQVPSTILEQPLFEDAANGSLGPASKEDDATTPLRRAETIRIYADNDVYALFADVEDQIAKMGAGDRPPKEVVAPLSDDERRELHRARSQELLNGSQLKKASTTSSPAPPSPTKENIITNKEIFLTNAVFQPGTSALGP